MLGQFDIVESQEESIARLTLGSPLRGVEFVAKGVEEDSAFAFVTTEFDGRWVSFYLRMGNWTDDVFLLTGSPPLIRSAWRSA